MEYLGVEKYSTTLYMMYEEINHCAKTTNQSEMPSEVYFIKRGYKTEPNFWS